MSKTRENVKKQFYDTVEFCRKKKLKPGQTQSYFSEDFDLSERSPEVPAAWDVQKSDVLTLAESLVGTGKVLVLNLASDTCPGGGIRTGRYAQEESLFARSAYDLTLDRSFYPLENDQILYSPNVPVIKNEKLVYIPWFNVSFVAVAAPRNPKIKEEDYKYQENAFEVETKVRMVFELAKEKGYRQLVLGALGCGCFKNPRKAVAAIFAKVIRQQEAKDFDRITFAVLDEELIRLFSP